MSEEKIKKERRLKRQERSRLKIIGLARQGKKPRLSVFRSNKYFYAQIIDDIKGITLISVNENELGEKAKISKTEKAVELGKILAAKAKKAGINKVVFDKGAYKYHGKVKSFADAARTGGLIF